MKEKDQQYIKGLIAQVEDCLRCKLVTPKDFEHASEEIDRLTGIRLSKTTLMRLWGYIREDVTPRKLTLTTLARFCGYNDWYNFVAQYSHHGDQQSNPVMAEKIDVLKDLHVGDQLRFTWQPGRVMEVLYHGNGRFEVIYSERTRLRQGCTFVCYLAIKEQPLFLSDVTLDGTKMSAYVCGKVNGVMFEVFPLQVHSIASQK